MVISNYCFHLKSKHIFISHWEKNDLMWLKLYIVCSTTYCQKGEVREGEGIKNKGDMIFIEMYVRENWRDN